MLEEVDSIELTKAFHTSAELMVSLENDLPHVLLLDINLPDSSGLEVCSQLRKQYPDLGIIGLSNYDDTAFIKNMMRNGANGYLLKNTKKEELSEAISAVHSGEQYLPRKLKEALLNESLGSPQKSFIPKLSRREKEILELVAQEMTSSEIAEKLFISLKTVESHRKNLFQKFNVKNTAGLVKKGIQTGLLDV